VHQCATIWLSFGGLALAFCYPFMKRYTYYPQVVLGAAFSWGMPMAFTAETGELPAAAWLLYIANLLWTVGYDTYYAMTDRDDDLKIGVKSTAILFGEADRVIILTLQACRWAACCWPVEVRAGGWFHLGLLVAAGCFAWEFWYTRDGPDALLQGVFAQPLGGAGDFCRDRAGLRVALRQEPPQSIHAGAITGYFCDSCDVPDVFHAVTGHVARLFVLDEGVQRLAVVGPLHHAVITLDGVHLPSALAPAGPSSAASSSRNRRCTSTCRPHPCRRCTGSCLCDRPTCRLSHGRVSGDATPGSASAAASRAFQKAYVVSWNLLLWLSGFGLRA
jgi:hypothetical protein